MESGQDPRIMQIDDLSATFDMANNQGILHNICSAGIAGSMSSIQTQFLSNRLQHVMMDSCRSKLVNLVSGLPQGSVLGPTFLYKQP